MSLPSRTLDATTGATVSQHALPVPARSSAHAVARKAPGLHLIGDLYGCVCDSRLMFDAAHLEDFCKRQVQAAGLNAVGSLFHSFGDEGGVTGVVVLAESHLSIHTWPEDGYVTLDVYVCSYSTDNSGKAQDLFERLMQAFNPAEPHLHRVVRA
ncbi:MAG: adenosylmethionine decarboxylase [Comamonadaceae bacterium]|nr:adenosylmethionine decarboxylase [Comamonadaceae bacterium]